MRNAFPWINEQISLFDMTTGTPLWLDCVGVSEIKWTKGNPINGVKAIVTLFEYLGGSDFLTKLLDNNTVFDLVRHEAGPKDAYSLDCVVASFTDCEILSKSVEDMVIFDPSLVGAIMVSVQMRVNFKLVLK